MHFKKLGFRRGSDLSMLSSFAAQIYVLAILAPHALAAQSLGVASGVDAPLSTLPLGEWYAIFEYRPLHRGFRQL
jgi:hypothetical protein